MIKFEEYETINVKFKKEYQELIDSNISLKKKLSKILDDTINYFNIDKLCVSEDGDCRYDSETLNQEGEGCAVGRMIEKESREKLDKCGMLSAGSNTARNRFTKEIMSIDWHPFVLENNYFFLKLQSLHDCKINWNKIGLSEIGVEQYNNIKKEFEL